MNASHLKALKAANELEYATAQLLAAEGHPRAVKGWERRVRRARRAVKATR